MATHTTKANMMALTALAIAFLIVILLIGLGIYLIFFDQKRGQAQCDEIALNLAESLNADNRIGQMNTIVEHSRELVYLSRQTFLAALDSPKPVYMPLAEQLLTEATYGTTLVEQERQNQIGIAVAICRDYALKRTKNKHTSGTQVWPWLFDNQLTIHQIEFGSIENNLSNVESPIVIKDLHKLDIDNKYIETASNLFYGNINAKLPRPDDAIPFNLSILPAQVENTNSPARLMNPEVFIPSALIYDPTQSSFKKPVQLPSAVHVTGSMGIVTNNADKAKLEIEIGSVGTAPGALDHP